MESIELDGVPETMLWTLHNRASEALKPNGLLHDPDAIRIHSTIACDYASRFGKPDDSHALRSRLFDEVLRPWMARHAGGLVIELGCGLETQFHRCDDGQVDWLCIDLPSALSVRERLLPPVGRCMHLACSALDFEWMDAVDARKPVFITAQGLLMYFEETQVRELLSTIDARLPMVELLFDVIPPWFSRKTMAGYWKTPNYRVPPMPWGIRNRDISRTLRNWMPHASSIELQYPLPQWSGTSLILAVAGRTPGFRDLFPAVVHVLP